MAPPAELSMRYLPDLSTDSDMGPPRAEYSDTSFQIPITLGGTSNDMLLAESSMDFLRDNTISTPAMPRTFRKPATRPNNFPRINEPLETNHEPLSMAELSPKRQRELRRSPRRSPLKYRLAPETVVPSPLRRAVEENLAAAIEANYLSFEPKPPTPRMFDDMSFAIPFGGGKMDNLLADDSDFLGHDDSPFGGPSSAVPPVFSKQPPVLSKQPPLTLAELTPKPSKLPAQDAGEAPLPKLDSVDEMLRFLRAESGKLDLDESIGEDEDPAVTEPAQPEEAEPALESAPAPPDAEAEGPGEAEISVQAHILVEANREKHVEPASDTDEQIMEPAPSSSHLEEICALSNTDKVQKPENETQEEPQAGTSQHKRATISGGISKPSKAKAPQTVTGRRRSLRTAEKAKLLQKVETQRARRSPPATKTTGRERPKPANKKTAAPGLKSKPPSKSTARSAPIATADVVQASGSDTNPTQPAAGGLAALLMSYGEQIIQQTQQPPAPEAESRASETVLDVDQGQGAAAVSDGEAGRTDSSDHDPTALPVSGSIASGSDFESATRQESVTEEPVSQPRASEAEVMQLDTTVASGPPVLAAASDADETVAPRPPLRKRPASAVSGPTSPRRKRARVAQAPGPSIPMEPSASKEKQKSTSSGNGAASGKPRALQTSRVKNAAPAAITAGLSASQTSVGNSGKSSAGPGTVKTVDVKAKGKATTHVAFTGASLEAPDAARENEEGATHTDAGQVTEAGAGQASSRPKSRSGDRARVQTRAQSQRELERTCTPDAIGMTSAGGHAPRHHAGVPPLERPAASMASSQPARPTKPLEFHFASDSRLGARLIQSDSSSGTRSGPSAHTRSHSGRRGHPIPDFKALHALHASQVAAARAHVTPVVPVPIAFATDARAKERERFEEARRERERAAALLAEEAQRVREAEEEREIRELRRRAIPRAHEVPEWYASAPKRTRKAT